MRSRPRKSWTSKSRAAIQNLEPLRTQSFQLNYTKAAEIATQLTGTGHRAHARISQHARQRDCRDRVPTSCSSRTFPRELEQVAGS